MRSQSCENRHSQPIRFRLSPLLRGPSRRANWWQEAAHAFVHRRNERLPSVDMSVDAADVGVCATTSDTELRLRRSRSKATSAPDRVVACSPFFALHDFCQRPTVVSRSSQSSPVYLIAGSWDSLDSGPTLLKTQHAVAVTDESVSPEITVVGSLGKTQGPALGQHLIDYVSADIGQPKIAPHVAIGQLGVVETEAVQYRSLQVMKMGRFFGDR